MSLYTARGDSGMTDLSTGQRIAKNSWRVKAYGALDEFGSALGMARAFCENEKVKDLCLRLQKLGCVKKMVEIIPLDSHKFRTAYPPETEEQMKEEEAKRWELEI